MALSFGACTAAMQGLFILFFRQVITLLYTDLADVQTQVDPALMIVGVNFFLDGYCTV